MQGNVIQGTASTITVAGVLLLSLSLHDVNSKQCCQLRPYCNLLD